MVVRPPTEAPGGCRSLKPLVGALSAGGVRHERLVPGAAESGRRRAPRRFAQCERTPVVHRPWAAARSVPTRGSDRCDAPVLALGLVVVASLGRASTWTF